MGYRKINRDTKPATSARQQKAGEFAIKVYQEIRKLHKQGASLDEMSTHLVDCGIKSARGNFRWDRAQVARVLNRVKDRHLCP